MPAETPTVLQEIVARRRTHLSQIAERVAPLGTPRPSTRSLYAALDGSHRIIAECKSASPSLGAIRPDYDPGALAAAYSRRADAISVLCEPERFGGDHDHLVTVAMTTHLPVLCKDFIVDPIQIVAARHFGADAVLLMMSVLTDDDYAELSQLAAGFGMDVLTEVVDESELARALAAGTRIIGINHRDLHDLSIDLTRSSRLAPQIPAGVRIVAESGIRDHGTLRSIAPQVNGFLVGSQLSGQADVDRALRSLMFGENKVCGLTSPAAAQAARAAGAVFGGLVCEPSSPRHVTRAEAERIIALTPGLDFVAVTRATSTWEDLPTGITAVQLHAPNLPLAEELELIARARTALPGVAVWRALSMTADPIDGRTPAQLATALADQVDRLVLDAGAGGSGRTFDWAQIPPQIDPHRLLLAGGLTPANLPAALATGLALDLNSGFETAGRKDPALLREAFTLIRKALP